MWWSSFSSPLIHSWPWFSLPLLQGAMSAHKILMSAHKILMPRSKNATTPQEFVHLLSPWAPLWFTWLQPVLDCSWPCDRCSSPLPSPATQECSKKLSTHGTQSPDTVLKLTIHLHLGTSFSFMQYLCFSAEQFLLQAVFSGRKTWVNFR